MLMTDIRQGHWHGLAHADARDYMGYQVGNRYFRWRATPMGCSTSSYLFQATQWVLSKKFRRLGIRLINYSDDYAFFCKPGEAELLAVYLRGEFEAHDLELNIEKSFFIPQTSSVVLGVLIDLEAGLFEISQKKKSRSCEGSRIYLQPTGAVVAWARSRSRPGCLQKRWAGLWHCTWCAATWYVA